MPVDQKFLEKSAKVAIKALGGLEKTAIMLETWAPEVFPEVNEQGQKHFGRVMMESAAQEIRQAWADAIAGMSEPDISNPNGPMIVAEPFIT